MFNHFLHPIFSSHLKITIKKFLSHFSKKHIIIIQFTITNSNYQLLNSNYQNLLLILFQKKFLLKINLIIPYHTQTNLLKKKYYKILKPPQQYKNKINPK